MAQTLTNKDISNMLRAMPAATMDKRKSQFILDIAINCATMNGDQLLEFVHNCDQEIRPWAEAHFNRFLTRHPEIV
jgi:hypothetical protein